MSKSKKTSVLKIILNTLIIILFVAIVAAGAGAGFLYFKYKINIFSSINQIKQLNENVNLTTLVSNGYSQDDLDSINTKIQSAESDGIIQLNLTDRELCAYLNNHLDKIANFKIGDTTINLNDSGLEVLQITLNDIPLTQPNEHYCDMNVVLKLNITSLKNEKLNQFPMNLVKNLIPNELYFSADCSIDEVDGVYKVTPTNITINNLTNEDTKNFLETINKFVQFTTADELNQNISTALADALLGESGVYGKLQTNGATGYGWQSENKFVVYFVDVNQTYTITYTDERGVENPNLTEYTVKNNTIVLQDLTDNGYKFLGWYADVDGVETKITTIDASTMQNYTLHSKWEIIHYTINCDLRGGKLNGNSEYNTSYTIEDDDFVLPSNATKKINDTLTLDFLGWLGDNIETITKVVTIPHGSYGDKQYTAYYDGEELEVTLVVDGITINTTNVTAGTVLSLDAVNDLLDSNKLSGYTIDACYTDANLTNAYDYSTPIDTNQTIYATSKYLTNSVYFYPYLTQFENAVANPTSALVISNHEMLMAYIDYCIFYDITTSVPLNLSSYITKDSDAIMEEIKAAFDDRSALTRFEKGFSYGYGVTYVAGSLCGKYYLTETDSSTIAQNHFDGESIKVYTQQDYALRADDLGIRADDYSDFEINYVGKSLKNIATSEQLVWALENGYNPICVTSSSAETIYNKAKEILRNICTDDMDDIEKLQAIYKWLALNVNYDQEAYETFETMSSTDSNAANNMARTYDSWYAEGVFNYGKAVCEGYAKSLLIMAKLEGIPAICVSGNGHMWNKVYVNGAWYGIDATHGDLGLNNSQEIFTITAFLFTDTYKTTQGYTATNYTNFVANTNINSYDYIDFTYNGNSYDLLIDSKTELQALFNYISGYTVAIDCEFYTIEVAVATVNASNFTSWLNSASSAWSKCVQRTDTCGNVVFILQHSK